MEDPADKSDEQLREGTEALQQVADDVEAERERSGTGLGAMDNNDDDAEREPHEKAHDDYKEPGGDPLLTRRLPEQR